MFFKQFFPLTYRSFYKTASGETRFAVWQMWFGHVFNLTDVHYIPENKEN